MLKFPSKLNKRRILAVIPARGGSKGIPGKNIKPFGGIPLIAWTIREAKKAKLIDRLIVSTEDKKIAAVARKYGAEVPFLRPKALSRDNVPGVMPILHALQKFPGYSEVLCMQPTSPFRRSADIDKFIRFAWKQDAKAVVSVGPTEKHPSWTFYLGKNKKLIPILKQKKIKQTRQTLKQAWLLNGNMYYAKANWIKIKKSFISEETYGFPLFHEKNIDIDTKKDWEKAIQAISKISLPVKSHAIN